MKLKPQISHDIIWGQDCLLMWFVDGNKASRHMQRFQKKVLLRAQDPSETGGLISKDRVWTSKNDGSEGFIMLDGDVGNCWWHILRLEWGRETLIVIFRNGFVEWNTGLIFEHVPIYILPATRHCRMDHLKKHRNLLVNQTHANKPTSLVVLFNVKLVVVYDCVEYIARYPRVSYLGLSWRRKTPLFCFVFNCTVIASISQWLTMNSVPAIFRNNLPKNPKILPMNFMCLYRFAKKHVVPNPDVRPPLIFRRDYIRHPRFSVHWFGYECQFCQWTTLSCQWICFAVKKNSFAYYNRFILPMNPHVLKHGISFANTSPCFVLQNRSVFLSKHHTCGSLDGVPWLQARQVDNHLAARTAWSSALWNSGVMACEKSIIKPRRPWLREQTLQEPCRW